MDLVVEIHKSMNIDNLRRKAEGLSVTGNPWHKKQAEVIETCVTVLEDLDEDREPEDWEDKESEAFVDCAFDLLMDLIANLCENKISRIEGYFLSDEDLHPLGEAENAEPETQEEGAGEEESVGGGFVVEAEEEEEPELTF